MPQFKCIGTVEIVDVVRARGRRAAALAFKAEHGMLPDYIDGSSVVGECAGCGKVLFEGDGAFDTNAWTDDIKAWHIVCRSCRNERKKDLKAKGEDGDV